jgi:hypothetical protein
MKECGSGIGICGILFIVFLVLKLTNNITWSWLWVTCPLWILPVFSIAIILLFLLVAFIISRL